MKRFNLWRLKNQMLIGNALANVVGVNVSRFISHRSISPPVESIVELTAAIDWVFLPLSFLSVFAATVIWEQPVRRWLTRFEHGAVPDGDLDQKAKRRLLNEPFFLITADFIVWLIAAIVYTGLIARIPGSHVLLVRMFFQIIIIGVITATTAFFILEHMLQKSLAPVFFPKGGLSRTPKTLRIRIRTRMAALIAAVNLIPFLVFFLVVRGSYRVGASPEQALELLRTTVHTNAVLFIGLGVGLTWLVAANLTRPLNETIQVLRSIRNGRLDRKVAVTTNDEIGYAGDVINEMTEGLRERLQLRQSLELAREVQQNLLPKSAPPSEHVDIAGRSIYCDQTGGDYFDFFGVGDPADAKVALLVGDVSGHGISSALLMATARAFLRLRSFLPGSIGEIVGDVNRQLVADVEDSGQFMTLFYLVIDPVKGDLRWVRAGHDPAILYDVQRDAFEELSGPGMALGIDPAWHYRESRRKDVHGGQVILIGTDGIWESRNSQGRMFGKKAFLEVIRNAAAADAQGILNAVTDSLKHFQGDFQPEDDVTLVVVKI